MAGDWIKLRTDIHTDPAVIRLSSMLALDTFGVVGRLTAVWAWADTHASTGVIDGVGRKWIDRVAQHDGFADAMINVGWLKGDDKSITFPNFTRHMGAGAKTRLSAAERQRRYRDKSEPVTPVSRNSDGSVTVPSHVTRFVMSRDCDTCVYCGQVGDARNIQSGFMNVISIDHLTPSSEGGGNDLGNLVACCFNCNNTKNNRTPEAWGTMPTHLQNGVVYRNGRIVDIRDDSVTAERHTKRNKSVTREEKRREEDTVPSELASCEVAPVTTPRKAADSPHHRCIAYFCDMWQQKYREKYPFNAGKDAQAIKWLLGACGATEEGFRGVVGRYFADDDPFVTNARHNLGLLRGQLPKWLAERPAGSARPARQEFKTSAEKAREYAAATLIDALGGDTQ